MATLYHEHVLRANRGVKATERGAWLHATPQQRWRALAESMDSARQTAVRARGFVPAQAAIMPVERCCGMAWHGWVGEEGEVKIMLSAASLQALPGLFWALDGLSSANWGLDGKSSWSG
ncbi:hypothetical protein HU200_049502 [Digitaria exilis]|uniref:Uncharacterized protein n=1 Tax=Digitaria exilis TaxID=1010633 RepID=A0A835E8A2_9POAL|nr:hypothetical protein HU200_049502 [Digitaria exilis]